MGGSSKSSTDQGQTAQSADGVITGKVVNISSKGSVTYTEAFPDAVQNAFSQLVSLANTGIESTKQLSGIAVQAAQQAAQPDTELAKKTLQYLPVVVIGFVLIIGALVWKGK